MLIEPCLGVVCACLPTLAPLFQRQTIRLMLTKAANLFFQRSSQSGDSGDAIDRHTALETAPQSRTEGLPYGSHDELSLVPTDLSESIHRARISYP